MLSLKDLYIYNLGWLCEEELEVQFEGSSDKYLLNLNDIYNITSYPVYRFNGREVSLLFNMREEDKKYFKKLSEES